jgi:isoaspartyl peptidase/L-asparaginase-like protein (Ntn-hydrolase superfamily)
VLVIDETGFLKQGKASCGAARKYTGSAGKSPIAGSGCSQRMSHATAMPLSTGRGQYDDVIHLPGDPICRHHA